MDADLARHRSASTSRGVNLSCPASKMNTHSLQMNNSKVPYWIHYTAKGAIYTPNFQLKQDKWKVTEVKLPTYIYRL